MPRPDTYSSESYNEWEDEGDEENTLLESEPSPFLMYSGPIYHEWEDAT